MLDDKSEIPADWDRSGLPGWTYFSQELFDLERDVIFRTHWQLVCHISEVASAGQYVTLDIADERGVGRLLPFLFSKQRERSLGKRGALAVL